MKRIITGCLLLNFAMAAQAECNISSSIQNIDYGKRSDAMRQVDRGKTTQLADRTITLVMQCDQDAHIRVQLNTANISNNGFGFGPNGSLNLIASDAFSGSNNLDLALASGKNDNPGSTGTASISTSPNNWLVFMQNGQEVVIDSGKSVSLTLTMAPAFKDEGELTDMTDITGNLTVWWRQNEQCKITDCRKCLFAMSAQAADRVSIDVKVTLEAAACTPILSNGGVVNFGSHSVNRLSTQHYTQIGTRNINMTITCESATGIAITARDTRMDSMTTGKDSGGQSGVKYTLNGGGYISQTTRLFGLGKTKDNKNIGSYAVLIDSNNISASNGSQTLAVSIAGADAVITGQKRAWQTLTAYPLAVDQSYYYTFVKPGETTPTPVTNAIIPLQVSASIANDLGGSEKIELDGKAVISVVYL